MADPSTREWIESRYGSVTIEARRIVVAMKRKLIPLIKAEMNRRESLRSQTEVSEVVMA